MNSQLGLSVMASRLVRADGVLANVVERENARPGAPEWRLKSPAQAQEIEGYASATSVNRGDAIDLFVSTKDPHYTVEIFRTGWYGGTGGRRITAAVKRNGFVQKRPVADPATGLIECAWSEPYRLSIPKHEDPTQWPSGIYVAKLTAVPSGKQSYIIFVVRDDERGSDFLFQSAVTTYQAYNAWGGKSLYSFNSVGGYARKVSFDRPYERASGTAQYVRNGWEYHMVRWLERQGFDVTYSTNVDTHVAPEQLLCRRAFLSVGHDEYWSWEMRAAVEAARDAGVHLGFFSANTCYWQIRFEPSANGVANRTIVAYKEIAAREDPFAVDELADNDSRVTTLWRSAPVGRPEESLIGVMYAASPVDGDVVIERADHWVFAGTGLKSGARLRGLLGYEVDSMHGNAPAGTVRLAHSPFVSGDGDKGFSDMTYYRADSGAMVFATGTIQWSWGLDDWNFDAAGGNPPRVSPAAQRITRNVLEAFARGGPPANGIGFVP